MPALNYPIGALHDVMRATAARFPDRPAITFKDSVITFAEFDRDSNQLANGFAALGVTAGDRIALYLPNCPPYELAFYAASKLGAIACPMNPSYREREITYHVNDSGAKVMVTHTTLWPVVDACRPQLPNLAGVVVTGDEIERDGAVRYDDVLNSGSAADPVVVVEPSRLAALPYSSGTTGLPKGVMLTHRTLVCNQLQYLHASGIGPDDVYPIFLPLSHIYGVMLMNAALGSGARQILMERFDLEALVATIQKYGVTVLHLVPPVLLALANAPGLDRSQFRTVRYALSAAAP
jgi:long-chain acyl-CoA synthetase